MSFKRHGSKSRRQNGIQLMEPSHPVGPSPSSIVHSGDGEVVSFFRGATHVKINGSPSFNVRLCASGHRRQNDENLVSNVRTRDKLKLERRSKYDLSANRAIFYKTPHVANVLEDIPEGPVIMFSIDERRCDAFALLPHRNAPILIPLTIQKHELEALRLQMHRYLWSLGLRSRVDVDDVTSENLTEQSAESLGFGRPTRVMTDLLGHLWLKIVKPILDALAYTHTAGSYRRIYWCPSGPLAFVPLHAAGIYGPIGQSISNFAVSSYIPSVGGFSNKVGRNPRRSNRLLLIGQSDSDIYGPIPETIKEISVAAALVKRAGGDVTILEGEDATVEAVAFEMPDYGSVHFACHATQLPGGPLNGGFQLNNGPLTISDIIALRIPPAEFAFLSACAISVGSMSQPDETVHLAAGMIQAGYQSVVAAAWAIRDNFCSGLTEDFYTQLTESGQNFDPTNSAVSLHSAVQKLRKEVGDSEEGLLKWAPYVHFGV
ncbi:CHAT domain-containing protein [Crepidotus variabilis]|uniref:CHAT domain-containing protein n=1 Tax=Crepidotus variabilis TaxID=179855 RepID=A0A9P6EP40_9AGAR|nr:CHAT domain-containing protein [Crepidotus variabilis]